MAIQKTWRLWKNGLTVKIHTSIDPEHDARVRKTCKGVTTYYKTFVDFRNDNGVSKLSDLK